MISIQPCQKHPLNQDPTNSGISDVNYAFRAHFIHIVLCQVCVCVQVFLIKGFAGRNQILSKRYICELHLYFHKKKIKLFDTVLTGIKHITLL